MKNSIKFNNNKTRVFFNTIFVIIETIFDKFLFIIINVMLARYLSADNFGEYTSALGYATLFSTFCDIGINGALSRSLNRDSTYEKEHIASAFLVETILVFVSYSMLCFSLFFINYNINTIYLILILGIVRVGNEYMRVFFAVFNAHEKFIWSSLTNTLFAISFLIVTSLVVVMEGNYFHVAWSRLLLVFLFLIVLATTVFKKIKIQFSREAFKSFLPQMAYFGFSKIFANANKRVNIVIISMMLGTVYAGYFNNAFLFFTSLFFIPLNIAKVLMPHLMKESFYDNKDKFQFTYDFYTRFFNVISFYIGIVFFIFAENIILIIYGKKYLPAVIILKILAFALPSIFSIKGLMLTLIDRQKIRTFFEGITLIVNVITSVVFIYFFHIEGAALSSVVTYMTLNSLSGYYLYKNNYINFKNSRMVLVKILFISIFIASFSYVMLFKFHFFITLLIASLVYSILVLLFIVNKNDLRIVKEIFGKK